ncbi:LysM domain-containing protein [Streptomyces sp. M19]
MAIRGGSWGRAAERGAGGGPLRAGRGLGGRGRLHRGPGRGRARGSGAARRAERRRAGRRGARAGGRVRGGVPHGRRGRESLTAVAARYGIALEELLRLNPDVADTRPLEPGRRVCVFRGVRPAQLALFSPRLADTLILTEVER